MGKYLDEYKDLYRIHRYDNFVDGLEEFPSYEFEMLNDELKVLKSLEPGDAREQEAEAFIKRFYKRFPYPSDAEIEAFFAGYRDQE